MRATGGKLVELLGEEEGYFWPEVTERRATEASKAELLTLYPHRADIPPELWRQLFEHAERSIDILVYAAIFLHEQIPDLNDVLRERANAGCRIRVALGDPTGDRIRTRGEEEQFGLGIATRCELALMHYRAADRPSPDPRPDPRHDALQLDLPLRRRAARQHARLGLERVRDTRHAPPPARRRPTLLDVHAVLRRRLGAIDASSLECWRGPNRALRRPRRTYTRTRLSLPPAP